LFSIKQSLRDIVNAKSDISLRD